MQDDVRWDAPGAGHVGARPVALPGLDDADHAARAGIGPAQRHAGAVRRRTACRSTRSTPRFVNGYFYTRLRPLMAPDKAGQEGAARVRAEAGLQAPPRAAPPGQAGRGDAGRPSRGVAGHPRLGGPRAGRPSRAENLALQDVDLAGLDDDGLAAHYEAVLARAAARLPPPLRPPRLRPRPDRPAPGGRPGGWGIDARRGGAGAAGRLAEHVRAGPRRWAGCGPRWPRAARRRPRSTTSGPSRRRRRPSSTSTSATAACRCSAATTSTASPWASCPTWCWPRSSTGRDAHGTHDPEACAAALRARVPAAERAEFDDLLTEARFAMNLRDDNGPTTAEWRRRSAAASDAGDRPAAGRTGRHRSGRAMRSSWSPARCVPLRGAATPPADGHGRRAGRRRRLPLHAHAAGHPRAARGRAAAGSAMPPATATLR